jgi:hypothetical protein
VIRFGVRTGINSRSYFGGANGFVTPSTGIDSNLNTTIWQVPESFSRRQIFLTNAPVLGIFDTNALTTELAESEYFSIPGMTGIADRCCAPSGPSFLNCFLSRPPPSYSTVLIVDTNAGSNVLLVAGDNATVYNITAGGFAGELQAVLVQDGVVVAVVDDNITFTYNVVLSYALKVGASVRDVDSVRLARSRRLFTMNFLNCARTHTLGTPADGAWRQLHCPLSECHLPIAAGQL